jgi:hypothetical protein
MMMERDPRSLCGVPRSVNEVGQHGEWYQDDTGRDQKPQVEKKIHRDTSIDPLAAYFANDSTTNAASRCRKIIKSLRLSAASQIHSS